MKRFIFRMRCALERAPSWGGDGRQKRFAPRESKSSGMNTDICQQLLNPRSGELFALILPDMTVESFQVFVDEFASFVGEQTAVRLITDGAAAHRSTRLKVREELLIEHLPAYSPELNPVERLFKELRKELKNRVFESLEAIEEAVIKAIEPFLKDGSRVKKLTFYGWLDTTPT